MTRRSLILSTTVALHLVSATTALAQVTPPNDAARPLGSLRQQALVQQAWLKERLEVNLPVQAMGAAARALGWPDATRRVADLAEELAR